MSILSEGINNVYALTNQISNLQSVDPSAYDPKAMEVALQQNFNQMLNDLMFAVDSDDEDDKDKFDPFGLMVSSYTPQVDTADNEGIDALNLNLGQFDESYLNSLTQLQDNPLALQSFLTPQIL
jgi:hypothetical protein